MREIKRGDIVTMKEEWLNPGESPDTYYVVLEEQGNNRIVVQALGTGLAIPPTELISADCVIYAGQVPENLA